MPVSDFPDFSAEEEQIKRRQALAQAIQQQAMSPLEAPQAGHVIGRISPWAGVAKLGQALLANRAQSDVESQAKDLATRKQQAMANALRGIVPENMVPTAQAFPQVIPTLMQQQTEPRLLQPNELPQGMQASPNMQYFGHPGRDVTKTQPINPEKPSSVQEYEYAKGQGYKGTLNDWLKSQKTAVAQFNMGNVGDIESRAQAIAKGDLPAPSGMEMRTPEGRMVYNRVYEINPQFDATFYPTRQANEKAFTTGKQGQAVKSFNVALDHLDSLKQAANALQNGDYPTVNKVANFFGQQVGKDPVTNFNTIKQIVGAEVVKAITGTGGGVQDREHAQQVIDAANSPQQLNGAIENLSGLMKAQLSGLKQEYESGGGKNFERFLSKHAKLMEEPTTDQTDLEARLSKYK